MRVNNIRNDSTAEVKGHFADVIFFQGCSRGCPFCFNPSLIPFEDGIEMSVDDILQHLSPMSDVVVLTGGEPLQQDKSQLHSLVLWLAFKNKKIVLETGLYDNLIYRSVDKVLYSIKTFDMKMDEIMMTLAHKNVDYVVVYGHKAFDWDGFKLAHKYIPEIYHRFHKDFPKDWKDIYRYVKNQKKDFLVFTKIDLKNDRK